MTGIIGETGSSSGAVGTTSQNVANDLLQKKFYKWTEGMSASAYGWTDLVHPIGDGTLQITPATAGNLIEISFGICIGHANTWQNSQHRVLVATDGNGSTYGAATGLGDNGGYGGIMNYGDINQGNAGMGDTHAGVLWYAAANTNVHMFKFQYVGTTGGGTFIMNQNTNQIGGTLESHLTISEYAVSHSAITNGGGM